MDDLQSEYLALADEIRIGSVADHELQVTEFFRIFSGIAAENGDTPDLDYCPVLKAGTPGYRVDGYALDLPEGESGAAGDLYLAVCDFQTGAELPYINAKDVDRAVDGVERFFRAAANRRFLDDLEESSPAYQLAALIQLYAARIRRLRVLLLTNGQLRVRRNIFETRSVGPLTMHVNVLDLERYSRIANSGREPVEIDFESDFGVAIECLPASTGAQEYQSFLFAMPGTTLAKVFSAFGNRLLEQNVRTYLQARTNVNKGILRTIAEEPGMFFAYNNGITATASSVGTRRLPSGELVITNITDFQIVNGGQTTASLLYARDGQRRSLDHVYVQVKLSVVEEGKLEEVVPKISEYANTQNKVSLADLASNSPIQIKIERLSKEISAPQRAGELHSSKWFYERARGQYKNLFSYKSAAERRRLELLYPKRQLVTKTDLAKYELSFDGRPHYVSEGAQKCFNRYATTVLVRMGDGTGLNALWFRRAMAKAMIFTTLDSEIGKAAWYQGDRGYKAQIVTYAVAACAEGFREEGMQMDLDQIWREQSVPERLLQWMLEEARAVARILKWPPENVRNISEFAKKEFCWTLWVKGKVGKVTPSVRAYGIAFEQYKDGSRQGAREEGLNREVDFDVAIVGLIPRARELQEAAEKKGLASERNMSALRKLGAGRLELNKGEKNALKQLLQRLEIEV